MMNAQPVLTTPTPQAPVPVWTGLTPVAPPTLVGLSRQQLADMVVDLGEPAFRVDQLHHWLYVKCVRSLDEMTNLSKAFREKLKARYPQFSPLKLHTRQVSQDGTIKYLFELYDGNMIESVLMPYQERGTNSVCISSQVGCAVGCKFCATAKLGFKRDLTAAEIVDQYLYVQADSGQEVRNIVFMGQGEPMMNLDNLLPAIRILNASAEVGMRRMTVSTSGIVSRLAQFTEAALPVTLAISLHAPTNALRERIMPITRKWPLEQLIPALQHYYQTTRRRLTVEYILLEGVNDDPQHALQLAELIRPLVCNINLIPYNPISTLLPTDEVFTRPSRERIQRFTDTLYSASKKKVTVRLERGVDIDAACGQLANRLQQAMGA
jgi:23S rRNA (adenine2503-C2)-methyltransferase